MTVMFALSFLWAASAAIVAAATSANHLQCKPQPGSPHWPSAAEWRTLNGSVAGHLIQVVPPAAVCHPEQPSYDPAQCSIVTAQWTNSSYIADSPFPVVYNDDTCLPSPQAPCSAAGYPAYAVAATQASDVQAAVRFAARTGVRLVVKATGHDFPGRSSGRGSLEIWTHKLQGGIRWSPDGKSVTFPAGTNGLDLYQAAADRKVTIVGPSYPTVGLGGWALNAGHSPISSRYGLGADQVLAMDVVTADGKLRTLDANSASQDLFWALRGGGGSTFAVMLSLTVKTYPELSGTFFSYSYNTTANSKTYWDLASYMLAKIPEINDAGGMGYFYVYPSAGGPDPSINGAFFGQYIFPDKTEAQAKAVIQAVEAGFPKGDKIYNTTSYTNFTSFTTFWQQQLEADLQAPVTEDGRLGSWLLTRKALTTNRAQLRSALQAAVPTNSIGVLLGNVVAGKGVRNANIPTGSNAVLPAWRNAYAHLIIPVEWTALDEANKTRSTTDLRNKFVPALKSLAPSSGGYINENDPTNPSWQHDYFGANYGRLLAIKKKWDPRGVFWCKPCVGHELFSWEDGPSNKSPLEWGVGQGAGKLCKSGKY